jgi:pteridine reductase
MYDKTAKVALITGASQRIGAAVAQHLHALGLNLVLHYRHSVEPAHQLQQALLQKRPDSVLLIQAELGEHKKLAPMIETLIDQWGRLDVLINNASSFFPTPLGEVSHEIWRDLLNSNLKAPFFLSQAAAPHLKKQQGCIINMTDIHASKPLKNHTVYSVAKAGLAMLTQSLALELAPEVRVNAIAPGAILWPKTGLDEMAKQRIISKTALKRHGCPQDIAQAVAFLIFDAPYMTGQTLRIDGGRGLNE